MAQSRGRSALITSAEPAAWESCRIITPNLHSVYHQLFGGELLSFRYTQTQFDEARRLRSPALLDVARAIHAADPDRLIFTDHSPHPFPLLRALRIVYALREMPPLYFHVYGDFLLNAPAWKAAEGLLRSARTAWICASGRQAGLLMRLLRQPTQGLEVCPFPVNTAHYRPDESARREWRRRLGLAPDEFTLIYSGRLSLQKNIVQLIHRVTDFISRTGLPARMIVAGRFDDLGSPLFGVRELPGAGYARFNECLDSLAPEMRGRVLHVGHVSADELVGLYNASDCYVSLSLHHDEDYGMAPAEALCCGTPVILTSWGGYGGFVSEVEGDCRLVPVRAAQPKGLEVDTAAFFKALFLQSGQPFGDAAARQARAARYHDRLSFAAAAQSLTAIHNKPLEPFSGFNDVFAHVAGRMRKDTPYRVPAGTPPSFYEYIYQAYLG